MGPYSWEPELGVIERLSQGLTDAGYRHAYMRREGICAIDLHDFVYEQRASGSLDRAKWRELGQTACRVLALDWAHESITP